MDKTGFYKHCKWLLIFPVLIPAAVAVYPLKSGASSPDDPGASLVGTAEINPLSLEEMRFIQGLEEGSAPEMDSSSSVTPTKRALQLLKKTTSRELQGKIYHAIGRYHYFDLRDYKTALVMFKKACKVYPEQYNDPTQSAARSFIEVCSAEYSLIVIKRLVKAILFAVILITIALYGVTKPWKWFSAKKFTALLLLICGAVVLFLLLDHIASRAVSPSSGYFYAPVFSNEQLEGFGSRIRTSILLFFITGVIAIIIAVIPLSRIRFRFTRTALSLLFTLLVFLGITGLFCFHQTRGRSDFSTFSFEMNEASAFPYLTGKWYWMAKDFKPYVISDPRKFMNLNVYLSNEPVFKDWLEDKYAKIKALNHKDEGANN